MKIVCPCCKRTIVLNVNVEAKPLNSSNDIGDEIVSGPEGTIETAKNIYDTVTSITFKNNVFCLSGSFSYGSREKIEEAIVLLGGTVSTAVTRQVNYLVMGSKASAGWAMGNYGRKVESAWELRRSGYIIPIVDEETFYQYLQIAAIKQGAEDN